MYKITYILCFTIMNLFGLPCAGATLRRIKFSVWRIQLNTNNGWNILDISEIGNFVPMQKLKILLLDMLVRLQVNNLLSLDRLLVIWWVKTTKSLNIHLQSHCIETISWNWKLYVFTILHSLCLMNHTRSEKNK